MSPPAHQPVKDKPIVTDSDLLRRHLEGDEGAYPALVKRYEKELYNFLARFTGDATLADDVFQEAFLQLHISAATFDLSKRLKPWLFTIAANKARDAMRSRARKKAVPLDAVLKGDESERTSYADLLAGDVPKPDENLSNLETRQGVQNIVRKMPENLRTVLILSYFHGFQYKQIAEILDVPVGTIKSRLHAAVAHFAQRWRQEVGEEGP